MNVADLGLGINDELSFQLIGPNEQVFTEGTTVVVGDHELGSQPTEAIRLRFDRNLTLTLRSDEQAAVFYDLRMMIHYTEENINNPGVIENRVLEWLVESERPRAASSVGGFQTQTSFNIDDGRQFYEFLAANLEADPNLERNFRFIDLQYDAGGQELFDLSLIHI